MTSSHSEYLQLIQKAQQAAEAYRNSDTLLMSDEEYDSLIEQITILSIENGWTEAETLLNSVGDGVEEGGDIQHTIPMLSLEKANTEETLNNFLKTINGPVVLEPKLDGLAISAIYRNGKLVQVATRGNGTTGEDITQRSSDAIKGLPTHVNYDKEVEVRGEVFITSKDFHIANMNRIKYNYDLWLKRNTPKTKMSIKDIYKMGLRNRRLPENSSKEFIAGTPTNFTPEKFVFANSRNAVAGALRSERKFPIPMTFACYDLYSSSLDEENSYIRRLEIIEKLGVNTATSLMPEGLSTPTNVKDAVNTFGEIRKTSTLEYPTDGIVIKADNISERNRLGSGNKTPKWAIAYKYPSLSQQTKVEDIEITIGRTGRLSLRARLTPVIVDGTRIEYVSLHNVAWLQEKDIRIGDTVLVRRANDVIPYIDTYVEALRPESAKRWDAPETCPQCGEQWDKSTLLWRCISPSCGELNSVIFAAGRDYFDWEGLSEAILTRLNDAGKVNNIADVFDLTLHDLTELYMGENKDSEKVLGELVGGKIYDQIQKSKTRPLSAVLAALGIRTLGRTFGRRMAGHFGSMGAILKASVEDLTNVEGIALKKAEIIHAGLKEKRDIIVRLKNAGVTMVAEKPKNAQNNNVFNGKKVVVSGSIPGFTRSSIQEYLTSIGAVASSGVSSNTDFLIADEESKGNSKYKKAESLKVKIITPQQFLTLVGK